MMKSHISAGSSALIKRLKPKSEFSRNVLTLMTGTTIAQTIPIAISPILTRLYTPEDFGVFALYMSLSTIIGVVASGRYELAIMLPKKDTDAINVALLAVLMTFLVSIFTFLMILIFSKHIAALFSLPPISAWFYLIPMSILLIGVYQSLNYWSNRKKRYNHLAANRVLQSGLTSTANLAMGFGGFGSIGLVLSSITGQLAAAISIGIKIFRENQNIFGHINKLKIFALAKLYRDYPKKSAPGALFNTLSYQLEIILLPILYSSYYLGLYYFITKFVNLPKLFLSGSIWQVFLTNAGKKREDIFTAKVYKQKKLVKYTTLPIISGLFIYSDVLIVLFGESWKDMTLFISPLILSMHINFIVASFSLFVLINKPDAEMTFNITLALTKLLSIVMSFYIWENVVYTVYAFSIVQFVMFFLLGSWNYLQLGKNIFFFSRIYLPFFIAALLTLYVLNILFSNETILTKMIIYAFINLIYLGTIKYARL